MAKACIENVRIRGLHTTVGEVEVCIDDELEAYGGNAAQLERIKNTIGLDRRRVVKAGTTSLDLGEQAARQLMQTLSLEPNAVDALIFVTQTPDYFQPCNAALLHGRLGLPKTTAAFDVNLGCSGYVYALYLAHLMAGHGGCERVLVVAADTISQIVNPRDRAARPLFGDAGAATLVERTEGAPPAYFALHTDGSGHEAIIQPGGAFREPPSTEAAAEATDEAGNTRSRLNLQMNGADVFSFSIREEPPAIHEILEYAQMQPDDADAYVFHQANKYIIGNIAKRLKIDPAKAPAETVERYGNQSSASIPGALSDALAQRLQAETLRLVLSGFGVGLSWASAVVQLEAGTPCGLNIYQP